MLRQKVVAKNVLIASSTSYIIGSLYCNLRLSGAFSGPAKTLLSLYMGFGGLAYLSANAIEWMYFQDKVKQHCMHYSLDELE